MPGASHPQPVNLDGFELPPSGRLSLNTLWTNTIDPWRDPFNVEMMEDVNLFLKTRGLRIDLGPITELEMANLLIRLMKRQSWERY